jgi:hypothetical protein
MKRGRRGQRPPKAKAPPPVAQRAGRGPSQNPKLADQTRKVLGKHYASKYQTGRRG